MGHVAGLEARRFRGGPEKNCSSEAALIRTLSLHRPRTASKSAMRGGFSGLPPARFPVIQKLPKMRAIFEPGLKNHEREAAPRAFPELQAGGEASGRCSARWRRDDRPHSAARSKGHFAGSELSAAGRRVSTTDRKIKARPFRRRKWLVGLRVFGIRRKPPAGGSAAFLKTFNGPTAIHGPPPQALRPWRRQHRVGCGRRVHVPQAAEVCRSFVPAGVQTAPKRSGERPGSAWDLRWRDRDGLNR